eukprot:gb/GEZN01009196.1/.p1 GENE.gb/GEZN01009196.1/~~gb/GEZN01009196.1/.p1  ORF type:complete len:349 (-),score=47.30 gb/GEZN01009196.1/:272-1318(-)
MSRVRRIGKEIAEFVQDVWGYHIDVGARADDSVSVVVQPPPDAWYSDPIKFVFMFPRDYPFKPFKLLLESDLVHPMFHRNLNLMGCICDNWNPTMTMSRILVMALWFLRNPVFDPSIVCDSGRKNPNCSLYTTDRDAFVRKLLASKGAPASTSEVKAKAALLAEVAARYEQLQARWRATRKWTLRTAAAEAYRQALASPSPPISVKVATVGCPGLLRLPAATLGLSRERSGEPKLVRFLHVSHNGPFPAGVVEVVLGYCVEYVFPLEEEVDGEGEGGEEEKGRMPRVSEKEKEEKKKREGCLGFRREMRTKWWWSLNALPLCPLHVDPSSSTNGLTFATPKELGSRPK